MDEPFRYQARALDERALDRGGDRLPAYRVGAQRDVPAGEREPVILDPEPPALEEAIRPHSFVDGERKRCGLDLDDVCGRDRSCESTARKMLMV